MRQVEFTDTGPVFSPRLDVVAVTIELHDARIAVAIGYVYVAVPGESHVGRLVEQPTCLRTGIDSPQNQQDIAGRIQLEDKMASVISGPKIVVSVDAQTVRMREKSLANALNEVALRIVLGEHGLGSLEQEYVALRIHRDGGSFAGDHPFGELEEVGHEPIRKLGDGLECGNLGCCLLRAGLKWQQG